jgi:hypothetical protein
MRRQFVDDLIVSQLPVWPLRFKTSCGYSMSVAHRSSTVLSAPTLTICARRGLRIVALILAAADRHRRSRRRGMRDHVRRRSTNLPTLPSTREADGREGPRGYWSRRHVEGERGDGDMPTGHAGPTRSGPIMSPTSHIKPGPQELLVQRPAIRDTRAGNIICWRSFPWGFS